MQASLVQKPLACKAASCKPQSRGRKQLVCQAQRQEQGLARQAAAVSLRRPDQREAGSPARRCSAAARIY